MVFFVLGKLSIRSFFDIIRPKIISLLLVFKKNKYVNRFLQMNNLILLLSASCFLQMIKFIVSPIECIIVTKIIEYFCRRFMLIFLRYINLE